MKTIREHLQESNEQYTLSEAIERLGKEGWRFNRHTTSALNRKLFFEIKKSRSNQLWFIDETSVPVSQFPTAPDQLIAAIEACNILNGAKKETL